MDFDHGGDTSTQQEEDKLETFVNTNLKRKRCFIATVYIFWIFVLALAFAFLPYMSELEESSGFESYLELSNDEAWLLVSAWYIAVFVFGWLLFNVLRIVLISIIAPRNARSTFSQIRSRAGNKPTSSITVRDSRCRCLTWAFVPYNVQESALEAVYLLEIKRNPSEFPPDINMNKSTERNKDLELSVLEKVATENSFHPSQEKKSSVVN